MTDDMADQTKHKAAMIYNVVESVVLAFAVGLTAWTANTVIDHGNRLAVHSTMLAADGSRLELLEVRGSRSLEIYSKATDARLDKQDVSIAELRSTLIEIRAILVRLENIEKSQARIEKNLEEHMNRIAPKP